MPGPGSRSEIRDLNRASESSRICWKFDAHTTTRTYEGSEAPTLMLRLFSLIITKEVYCQVNGANLLVFMITR